jgi:HEAT repeat protein
MRIFLTSLLVTALALVAAPAHAQIGQDDDEFKKVEPPYATQPGQGPQVPFDELRWEFWWYFNREPLLGLREALFAQAAGQAEVDAPFVKLRQDDRVGTLVRNLVAAQRDSNPGVRAAAVLALGKTQEPSARPVLQFALEDKDFTVRLNAIVALGAWANTYFLGRLESILRDDAQEIQARFHAAIALGLIGGARTAESFRQMLAPSEFKSFPTQVQAGLAYAIGVARDKENVALARALLADKSITDSIVRSYLTMALGKAGTEADVPQLFALLADSDAQVRRSAAIGLGVLLRRQGGSGAGADAVKKLTQSMRGDADVLTRCFAAISLGWLGGPEAGKALREEFATAPRNQKCFVSFALALLGDKENVPLLVTALEKEADNSTRGALALSLGLLGDARGVPAVRKLFVGAAEPVLKGQAGLALGMMRDGESAAAIETAFTGGRDVEMLPDLAIALGLIGARPAVDVMLDRLKRETNEYVRQSLLYSIGLIGDRAALDPLCSLVSGGPGAGPDKDVAYVRAYAAIAIGLLAEERPIRPFAALGVDSNYPIRQPFLEKLFQIP